MPRRPNPLYAKDGPGARLALGLRNLKDQAIAEHGLDVVPSVKEISEKQKIPLSTIYAALRGRLPSRETLIALVTAWGDPTGALARRQREMFIATWLRHRSNAERDLESERRSARPAADPSARRVRPPGRTARSVRDAAATGNSAIQAFARELNDLYRAREMSLRELSRATETRQDKRYVIPGVSTTTLSYMLRGMRFQSWDEVQKVIQALGGDLERWRLRWIETARTTNLAPSLIDEVERDGTGPA